MCVCNVMKDKLIYPCKTPVKCTSIVIAEILGAWPLALCCLCCFVSTPVFVLLLLLFLEWLCFVGTPVFVLFVVCFVGTPLYLCCCLWCVLLVPLCICVVCGVFGWYPSVFVLFVVCFVGTPLYLCCCLWCVLLVHLYLCCLWSGCVLIPSGRSVNH